MFGRKGREIKPSFSGHEGRKLALERIQLTFDVFQPLEGQPPDCLFDVLEGFIDHFLEGWSSQDVRTAERAIIILPVHNLSA